MYFEGGPAAVGEILSNGKPSNGQPSRGIWNREFLLDATYSLLDISYVGMSPKDAINPGNSGIFGYGENIPNDDAFQISGNSFLSAQSEFINQLVANGCLFKFKRDPDDTVYTVSGFINTTLSDNDYTDANASGTQWYTNPSVTKGLFGIKNYSSFSSVGPGQAAYKDAQETQLIRNNCRQRWTLVVSPAIGSGESGYSPVKGTKPPSLGGPDYLSENYRRAIPHDGEHLPKDAEEIQILELPGSDGTFANNYSNNPSIWETIPKEDFGLDIYYQASSFIPIYVNSCENTRTGEELIPIGSTFTVQHLLVPEGNFPEGVQTSYTVTGWKDDTTILITPALDSFSGYGTTAGYAQVSGTTTFNIRNRGKVKVNIEQANTGSELTVSTSASSNRYYPIPESYLEWNNCWAFGNGVESDRITDAFNAAQMDNGVKASTTLAEPIRQERRKHGIIWSGIYNSNSGVNNTNQFIQAEPITKDLNPIYGSIQAFKNRNTRLNIFCEDKVLKAETNRDILFNADGNSQVVASNKVVGSAVPYQGKYGISTNPESLVVTPYNMYFTDAMRGRVLALSTEGVRPISDLGMKTYFADLLQTTYSGNTRLRRVLGTYDARTNEYNVTTYKGTAYSAIEGNNTTRTTISYSELAKGWSSFKSFTPQHGVSLNNHYYTFDSGKLYVHHQSSLYNSFYGATYSSYVDVLFNDSPESVKSFNTISYEGSENRITNFDTESTDYWLTGGPVGVGSLGFTTNSTVYDGEYYNLNTLQNGWYADSIITDNHSTATELEFKDKEGKYFGLIKGDGQYSTTNISTDDVKEFSLQGIGEAAVTHGDTAFLAPFVITVDNYDGITPTTSYDGNNNTGVNWDSTSDE